MSDPNEAKAADAPTPAAEPVAPAAPAVAPASPGPAPRHGWLAPVALTLACVALAGAGWGFWQTHSSLLEMQLQLARRIGDFDSSSTEARTAAKEARSVTEDLLVRITALETKAQDAQNQQLALATMYQELARSNDERLLADLEQGLLLVQQQLHLAGNIRAAVLGLEALEGRLAKLDKPQFNRLREAMSLDAARLRLLPAADVLGINARLDAMIQNVAKLKLETDMEPRPADEVSAEATLGWLERLRADAWGELKQLVRIRRLDHPEMPLLTPGQVYFLRQNLILRLLSARLSLLQRDETIFRSDISAAADWVKNYFNRQDPATQAMLDSLESIRELPVANREIDIQESLKALKAARSEAP